MHKEKSKYSLKERRGSRLAIVMSILSWIVLTGVFVHLQQNSSAQNTPARIYVQPSSGTYETGKTMNFQVRVNLNNNFNAASTRFTYSKSTLRYVRTAFHSGFNGDGNTANHSASGGYINIYDNRTSGGPLRGDHALATVVMERIRPGAAYVRFSNSVVVLYPTANYTVVHTNGSYTFRNPVVDVCPNISGTQTTIPTGYIKNSAGNCVKRPRPDVCPNISGRQTSVPSGYIKNSSGNCVKRKATTPKPQPKPTAPIKPRTTAQKPVSRGSIKLTKFKISSIGYQTARITWNTNTSSSTLIEYGTEKDNLSQKKTGKNGSSHTISFASADKLLAGTTYYIKVTSKDGSQTVSASGQFTTKPVPVIITVTDTDNKPVNDASVSIGEVVGVTNEKGEAELALPSGYQLIIARKGDLYREVDAQILIPSSSDKPKQRVTLNLGEFNVEEEVEKADTEPKKTNSSTAWLWSFLLVPLLVVGATLFILFIRRRKDNSDDYIGGDILEAENYSAPVQTLPSPSGSIPPHGTNTAIDTPPVISQADAQVPQYASLPELVGRYASSKAVDDKTLPPDSAPSTSPWMPPPTATGYTSLKDMVVIPGAQQVDHSQVVENDLPISPLSPPDGMPIPQNDSSKTKSHPDKSKKNNTESDYQDSITIEH